MEPSPQCGPRVFLGPFFACLTLWYFLRFERAVAFGQIDAKGCAAVCKRGRVGARFAGGVVGAWARPMARARGSGQ